MTFFAKFFCLLAFILLSSAAIAQVDSASVDSIKTTREVIVSGFVPESARLTSLNIEPYSVKKLNESGPQNLTEALSRIPGVLAMSTGNANSKPIVRGMYGNRLLILMQGLRFDNQQWQDEHGLGLSQNGIESVEIIRGPASLLYGSEAIGGVISLIDQRPKENGLKMEASVRYFSNSKGQATTFSRSYKAGNKWNQFNFSADQFADYSSGNGSRILNSRSKGIFLKYGFGNTKNNVKSSYFFTSSANRFGFIFEDIYQLFTPDNRWSFKMNGPFHQVFLNIGTAAYEIKLSKSRLLLNLGVQSNVRMEDEGGGQISLNMHLFSALQSMRWEKQLKNNFLFIATQQYGFTSNVNYGGRKLIPNGHTHELNTSAYLRKSYKKVKLEAGFGATGKQISTFLTKGLNSAGEPVSPFSKTFGSINGSVGICYSPTNYFSFKSNISSGFRAPNFAELSANGLHEGVYRYEIGTVNLKPEQNFNVDLTAEYNQSNISFSASAFQNLINQYIYLQSTGEKYFSFPVYRYTQTNARLFGGEVVMRKKISKQFAVNASFSSVIGKKSDGSSLPFIPANRWLVSGRFEKSTSKTTFYIQPEIQYTSAQTRPSVNETATKAYLLLNCSAGIQVGNQIKPWKLSFSGNNLSNQQYVDYLSRIRVIGMGNMGRNLIFTATKSI